MEYELDISPYARIPFDEFSREQAKEYFEWHMSRLDHRIQVLEQYVRWEGFEIAFDYSPESLILLWEWYEGHIVLEKKSWKEYLRELRQYPKWMRDEISRTKISMMKTMKFGSDIALYFAESICRNSDGKISWGYFTGKKLASVNRPVLMGFMKKMYMDPQTIIYTCTLCSAEEKDKNILFDTYNVWQKYII